VEAIEISYRCVRSDSCRGLFGAVRFAWGIEPSTAPSCMASSGRRSPIGGWNARSWRANFLIVMTAGNTAVPVRSRAGRADGTFSSRKADFLPARCQLELSDFFKKSTFQARKLCPCRTELFPRGKSAFNRIVARPRMVTLAQAGHCR
jgi:hypothetical protein